MIIEQLYTNCLAQGAYYIESNGEAAIIDPLRETNQYIELANKRNAKIKYVLETHFHADFVSGHIDLANKTGAKIVFGPNANPKYDIYLAKDEEILELGDIKIKVLHTPGHTLESTSYLLLDKEGNEQSVFTGDTLFIGDVGRPDLAQKSDLTIEDLAGMLFVSLRNKIMTLPDNVIVYPGHGAGSACGKKMSDETQSTIGLQKISNYALQDISKEQFISEVTDGLATPPAYFPDNVKMNKEGYGNFDTLLSDASTPLNYNKVLDILKTKNAIILDVRSPKEFAKKHIKNAINIGLDGTFAPWVGAVISDVNTAIILDVENDKLEETITRLARVGFDNVLGYIEGGIESWIINGGEVESQKQITASEFSKVYNVNMNLLDVRKANEFNIGHLECAVNIPLDTLKSNIHNIRKDETVYIHCLGGYRATIASSILKQMGIKDSVVIYDDFQNIYDSVTAELV